jgi:hypothetical protein
MAAVHRDDSPANKLVGGGRTWEYGSSGSVQEALLTGKRTAIGLANLSSNMSLK